MLTYTTTASQSLQDNDPQYLESAVFDTLGSQGWTISDYRQARRRMRPRCRRPRGCLSPGSFPQFTTDVNVASGALVSRSSPTFLPMPYPAAKVTPPPGFWLADNELMVYSQEDDVPVKTYQVTSYAWTPPGRS